MACIHKFLKEVLFSNRSKIGGITMLSNNRGIHYLLSGVVVSKTGMLLLSRPAGRLSVRSVATLGGNLVGFPKMLLFASESRRVMRAATGHVVRVIPNNGLVSGVAACSRCLRDSRVTEGERACSMRASSRSWSVVVGDRGQRHM